MRFWEAMKTNLPKTVSGWSIIAALPAFMLAQLGMTELRRDSLAAEFYRMHHEIVPVVSSNQSFKSEENSLSYLFSYTGKGKVETRDIESQKLVSICEYEFSARHFMGFVTSSSLDKIDEPSRLISCTVPIIEEAPQNAAPTNPAP